MSRTYDCKCVDKVNEALMKQHNGKYVLYEGAFMSITEGTMNHLLIIPFRNIKTDKIKESGLMPNFCPFCGKKLIEKDAPANSANSDS